MNKKWWEEPLRDLFWAVVYIAAYQFVVLVLLGPTMITWGSFTAITAIAFFFSAVAAVIASRRVRRAKQEKAYGRE